MASQSVWSGDVWSTSPSPCPGQHHRRGWATDPRQTVASATQLMARINTRAPDMAALFASPITPVKIEPVTVSTQADTAQSAASAVAPPLTENEPDEPVLLVIPPTKTLAQLENVMPVSGNKVAATTQQTNHPIAAAPLGIPTAPIGAVRMPSGANTVDAPIAQAAIQSWMALLLVLAAILALRVTLVRVWRRR